MGVVASGQIAVGLVHEHELAAPLRIYPPQTEEETAGARRISTVCPWMRSWKASRRQ